MSLFKKIFGSADPLDRLRRALQQGRWAEALAIGEELNPADFASEAQTEIGTLVNAARDGLAELNLNEGEAFLRAGERALAVEHLSLAARHAHSADLVERIARAREEIELPPAPLPPPAVVEPTSCATADCSSGGGSGTAAEEVPLPPSNLDSHTRYELILTSYPPRWVARYETMGEAFREAFLLAHEGLADEALAQFEGVPAEERNDLFFFERGALLARLGRGEEGRSDLEQALDANPEHTLAMETLVNLDLEEGRDEAAEQRLRDFLDRGIASGYCHGRLAAVYARRNDPETALQHGLEALREGGADIDAVILTASLLEGSGRVSEAEQLLTNLPAGGCSGGVPMPLAEFWLRRGKNLDQALEVFKEALRLEPGVPRWPIRIAQTYLALGWKKEAFALVEKVLGDPRLDPDLQREARTVLAMKESD